MSKMDMRVNNFDLLRLLAATQVMVVHTSAHLGLNWDTAHYALEHFPGVPIFFALSGFLISASYERNSDLKQYGLNRALRIFPALWACLAASIALAYFVGGIRFPVAQTIPWLAAQMSFAQFYNPDFLRPFGVGVLNGSLWTISVELQFYAAVPIIYWAIGRRHTNTKLIAATVLLAAFHMLVVAAPDHLLVDPKSPLYRLTQIFLPTYLYLFMVGVLLQRNYSKLSGCLEGKGIYWLVAYVVVAFSATNFGSARIGNNLSPFLAVMLAFTIVSLAVTAPALSGKILGGNDISYGVYIYHMPIVNSLLSLHVLGAIWVPVAALLTYIAATASAKFIETPAKRLKKNPLHTATVPAPDNQDSSAVDLPPSKLLGMK